MGMLITWIVVIISQVDIQQTYDIPKKVIHCLQINLKNLENETKTNWGHLREKGWKMNTSQ